LAATAGTTVAAAASVVGVQTKKSFAAALNADRLQQQNSVKSKRKSVIVGTLRSPIARSGDIINMSAGRPLLGKAVYCVDNVNPRMTASDLERFVKQLSVRVISVFDSLPRRTRKEIKDDVYPVNRKTFRLCINKADARLLTDPEKWPADVAVSEWSFKPRKIDNPISRSTGNKLSGARSTSTGVTDAAVSVAEGYVDRPAERAPDCE